jgi:hypothetical protein
MMGGSPPPGIRPAGAVAEIGRRGVAGMCTVDCLMFGIRHPRPEEVKDRDVIEVGACEVAGSLRPVVESWGPGSYLGVDIVAGNGVDEICDFRREGSLRISALQCRDG